MFPVAGVILFGRSRRRARRGLDGVSADLAAGPPGTSLWCVAIF
jgi:hypothetical protein